MNDTYKKDEKVTTNIEPYNRENVVKKAHQVTKLSKVDGHLSLIETDYNVFKVRNDKGLKWF